MLTALKHRVRQKLQRLVAIQATDVQKYLPYQPDTPAYLISREIDPHLSKHRGLPLPSLERQWSYGFTQDDYIARAEADVTTMRDLLSQTGLTLKAGDRILDHGCADGRLIRCFNDLAATCEIWGTDISANDIYWCKQNLSPPFHFATTTMIPHLPFEDRYFTLIYAASVFTHMDDLADAWLLELHRILASGGRAYLTIQDQHTLARLEGKYGQVPLAKSVKASGAYSQRDVDRLGMLAINRSRDWCMHTFYDTHCFCRMLEPMYRVLKIVPEAYCYQTAVIVERR